MCNTPQTDIDTGKTADYGGLPAAFVRPYLQALEDSERERQEQLIFRLADYSPTKDPPVLCFEPKGNIPASLEPYCTGMASQFPLTELVKAFKPCLRLELEPPMIEDAIEYLFAPVGIVPEFRIRPAISYGEDPKWQHRLEEKARRSIYRKDLPAAENGTVRPLDYVVWLVQDRILVADTWNRDLVAHFIILRRRESLQSAKQSPKPKKRRGPKFDPARQKIDRRIYKARKSGTSYEEIASEFRCTVREAKMAYDRARKCVGR